MSLTQEKLKTILKYVPETGKFFWIVDPIKGIKRKGLEAGHIGRAYGYRRIMIEQKSSNSKMSFIVLY